MNPEAQNPVTADPSGNTTLTEVVDGYRAAGYDGDFFAEGDTRVRCGSCQSSTPADLCNRRDGVMERRNEPVKDHPIEPLGEAQARRVA